MKYCSKCGKENNDTSAFCAWCGCSFGTANTTNNTPNNTASQNVLLKTLSERLNTEAIIWIVIGVVQILSGVLLVVGVLNIITAVNDLNYSKDVLKNPTGIVERFEPVTMPLVVLGLNAVFGGLIGVAGSIYYLIAIRGYVMENKEQFAQMGSSL